MSRNTLVTLLSMGGLILIMAALALPVLHIGREYIMWVYAVGAALLLAGRLLTPVPAGASVKLRRLLRMEVWTALVFVAGAVFLFLPVTPGAGAGNDWIAFTLAGGVLTVYTSLMIPRQR
ncbi:MAG: hypothetical protein K2G05_04870 [Duncaniella sp.]|nr:hypothetical protein [Bacteroides sp.]MDE6037577.1 hypothetical protein [Duncaniella sp.]MDE6066646.1 hypothetical protein [Duncaniella sp.]